MGHVTSAHQMISTSYSSILDDGLRMLDSFIHMQGAYVIAGGRWQTGRTLQERAIEEKGSGVQLCEGTPIFAQNYHFLYFLL